MLPLLESTSPAGDLGNFDKGILKIRVAEFASDVAGKVTKMESTLELQGVERFHEQ